jgi:hypothetical protein
MERWDHGERSRGGAPARSPRRKRTSAALPVLGWLHGGNGEVEEVQVGLRVVGMGQRCDGSSSRARRARGGGGVPLLSASVETEGMGWREWAAGGWRGVKTSRADQLVDTRRRAACQVASAAWRCRPPCPGRDGHQGFP